MVQKVVKKIQRDNEAGARRAILEDLFYDFHKTRQQVYWMNFIRGLFFGVGSVLGGTLVIAILVWLLSLLTDIPGGIGEFVQYIVDVVQSSTRN
jgi:hypothetical protein